MPTPAKRASKKAAPLPENRTESEILADALLARYNDLAPSLNRIMGSGLGEAGRLHAITAFQDSLGVVGDPMRDPHGRLYKESYRDAQLAGTPGVAGGAPR